MRINLPCEGKEDLGWSVLLGYVGFYNISMYAVQWDMYIIVLRVSCSIPSCEDNQAEMNSDNGQCGSNIRSEGYLCRESAEVGVKGLQGKRTSASTPNKK